MTLGGYELARRLRDSNVLLALTVAGAAVTLVPLFSVFTEAAPVDAGERLLRASWWTGTAVLTAYGVVHVSAAIADTHEFLDDHGTEYAGEGVVFCHALGQRLFVLLGVGFALVFLAVTGPGVDVPFVVLLAIGLLAATFVGLAPGIPMNRRVTTRLAEYRDR